MGNSLCCKSNSIDIQQVDSKKNFKIKYDMDEAKNITQVKPSKFMYDQPLSPSNRDLIERGPQELEDGAVYTGEWTKNGLRQGKGEQTNKDGSYYKGYWKNNNMHGKGVLIYSDGRKYEGKWQNNQMHDLGTFTWPDGRIYIGQYVDGKKEGFGEFKWPDGRLYQGDWLNGKQHGKGYFKQITNILSAYFQFFYKKRQSIQPVKDQKNMESGKKEKESGGWEKDKQIEYQYQEYDNIFTIIYSKINQITSQR